jgi:hypothetical protein
MCIVLFKSFKYFGNKRDVDTLKTPSLLYTPPGFDITGSCYFPKGINRVNCIVEAVSVCCGVRNEVLCVFQIF